MGGSANPTFRMAVRAHVGCAGHFVHVSTLCTGELHKLLKLYIINVESILHCSTLQVTAPGVAICLFCLNIVWFGRICRGAVRLLTSKQKQV